MIIAVSMRTTETPEYRDLRDAISHDWIRLLDEMGVTPILVPNALRDPSTLLSQCDVRGLLLTGGDNLGPLAGEAANGAARPARDRTEAALLDASLARGLPVFGVCRGLQVINVYFGGGLLRELTPWGSHVNNQHAVQLTDSWAGQFSSRKSVTTNSFHAHGVTLRELAPRLKAFAVANTVVEGLRHDTLPVFAVQWHPERNNPASDLDRALLKHWVCLCA